MKNSLLLRGFKDPPSLLKQLKKRKEEYWIRRGELMVLKLFRQMAKRVPAYKDFLKKHRVDEDKIKTIEDFKLVPTIDKENYLKSYPLEKVCWDGRFRQKRWTFSTTSGSTGEPYYFPREDAQDWQYAVTAELYLRSNFEIDKKSTLYINGFAMGAWIGGLFTYQAIKYLAERGDYQLSIINPGILKEEIIKAIKNLGDKFDQIIIGGYPPMIKAMIDEGIKKGIDWRSYNLGFIFSAEGFGEKFRDYIIEKAGLKNPYKDTLNHYGTVDLGTMAHETPLSILIRRLTKDKPNINRDLFQEEFRQPTLTQYIPELFYFEGQDNGLICSAYSGIPLVRYDLKDHGEILTFQEVINKFSKYGINLLDEAKKTKITDASWNLPFAYVFERKDFTVKLYGANIYTETIRKVLHEDMFENELSGKFTMLINFDKQQNQYLEIHIELKDGISTSRALSRKVQDMIVKKLLDENSEYRSNYKEAPNRQIPKIIFWEYEHSKHFSAGGKHKWVKNKDML